MIEIDVPLQSDTSGILQIATDYLQSIYPLWTPNPASYDVRELTAHAAMVAEFIKVAAQVPEGELTRFVGTVVYRTPPLPAIAATAESKWTLLDAAEHTIPAGTNISMVAADGTVVVFQTTEPVVKKAGGTTVAKVPLVAVEAGAIASGLSGAATLLDSLVSAGAAWVQGVTIEGETTGGKDAETDAEYTQRIVNLAPLLKMSIVKPADYAAAARLLVPQIARALAIDEYDAETKEEGVERCVSVAAIDTAGQPSTAEVKAKLLAEYERLRERTFLPFIIDPTYTAVNIDYKGVASPGATPADVNTRAKAAVAAFISPATWGTPDTGDTTSWEDRPIVRFQDVVTVLNNVEGFDHYTALTLNGGGADVALAGPAALPQVGAITGEVT